MSGELESRATGKIVKIIKDYGFISTDSVADQDVYFKTSWYSGDGFCTRLRWL
jgi:hypothetical protein